MKAAIMILALALTAGCGRKDVNPDVPRGIVIKPEPVVVTRTVYVAVPVEFTEPLPIASGPLSHCPDVAAARRQALQQCNADRAKVRALGGTVAKP